MNKHQKSLNTLFSQTILKKLAEIIERMKYFQIFEILKTLDKKEDSQKERIPLKTPKASMTLGVPKQIYDGMKSPERDFKRKINETTNNLTVIKPENEGAERNSLIRSNTIIIPVDPENNNKISRGGVGDVLVDFQASEHKIYNYKDKYEEARNIMKFETESNNKKMKNKMLKIGDIIYFKYIMDVKDTKKDSKSQVQTSILSGDGIANNKLECILKNSSTPKNASFLFKNCLFRVETSRKYNNSKLLQKFLKERDNFKQNDINGFQQEYQRLQRKIAEENEENTHDYQTSIGNPITYGQNIHLRHIYSGCFLTINPNKLSKQYGCIEISLEESGSEYSIFKFVSSSNLKKKEDAVCYSDSVLLSSATEGSYYIHVWEEFNARNNFEHGLEINGSEIPSSWKILHYLSHEELKIYENNKLFVEPGNIIQLCHKKTNAVLTVSTKNLMPLISPKTVYLRNEAEDHFGPQRRWIEVDTIDNSKTTPYQIFLQNQSKISYYSLWEVQRKSIFDGGFAKYIEPFRLKNVSTGLFLSQDLSNPDQLILNPDGNCDECFFYFKPKKVDLDEIRLEYDDLIRVQTINSHFLQSIDENLKEKNILCGPKIADTSKMSFFLRTVDYGISEVANRISSLFPFMMSFYIFLQDWGVVKQYNVNKKEYMMYDYQKALDTERDLELEVDQLIESLNNLDDFIMKKDQKLNLKAKQNILLEQKITEILIIIAKLIDCKLYVHSDNQQENSKTNRKLFKIADIKMEEEWLFLEKTPQYIARKYLSKPLRSIYSILLACVKENSEASKLVIKSQAFLSSQLVYYKNEVGVLLKEIIKNATYNDDKDNIIDDVIEWVYLLEMIKITEGNVPLQILYLELLSLGCTDSFKNTGISLYQNKIINEMTLQHSKPFLKKIIKIEMHSSNQQEESKPYIIFSRDENSSIEDFLDTNRCLDNNIFKTIIKNEEIMFNLEDLSKYINDEIELILDYIVAAIMLFYSLCKGRNFYSIKIVSEFFPHELIFKCMTNDLYHIKIRRAFIFLYQVLYIDIEPFIAITNSQNRCYVWDDLDSCTMEGLTFQWLNLNPSKKYDKSEYDEQRIQELNKFILDFWMNGMNEESMYDKANSEKIKFLHSMLVLTKNAIDFCWANEDFYNKILYNIIHIFIRFSNNKEMLPDEHWLTEFLLGLKSDQKDDLGIIYTSTLDIFLTLAKLRENIHVLSLIKLFKYTYESPNGFSKFNKDNWNNFFTRLFQIYGLNIIKDLEKARIKTIQDLTDDKLPLKPDLNEKLANEIKKYREEGIIHGGLILLNVLFKVADDDYNSLLEAQIIQIFKEFFSQRQKLKEIASNIEMIVGQNEYDILCEFDINSKTHILSAEILERQITKLLLDDEQQQLRNHKIENNIYKQAIIDIRNNLEIMIAKFKSRKTNYKLYYKTQNILRNLNIHHHLMKIFKLNYKEKEHLDLFKAVIKFLCHFCKKNLRNQNELYGYVNDIVALIPKKLKPTKLLSLIFTEIKRSVKCSGFIDYIFQPLMNSELNFQHDIEYIIVLRTLLLDHRKLPIQDNQRKIISKIMKNRNFLNAMDYKYEFKKADIANNSTIKDETSQDILNLEIHIELVLLLAGVTLECGIGIQQAKKILSFDYIKAILSNPNTPFIQKKPLLRCLYQIHITKFEELNEDFDKSVMIDIFNAIVIPDLQVFHKYIEGIVSINSNSVQKRRKAKDLRIELSEFKNKLANIEIKQDKNQQTQIKDVLQKSRANATNNNFNAIDNQRFIYDVSEYWDYLNSGKSWDLRQDGLLYFILDCFYEIESRKWLIDDNLSEVLSNTRYTLSRIADVLLKIQEQYELNLSRFQVLINEFIDNFENKRLVKIGKNFHIQGNDKNVNITQQIERDYEEDFRNNNDIALKGQNNIIFGIFRKIKTYIMKKKLTIDDFCELLETNEFHINCEDFKNKMKILLGNMITTVEIDDFMIEFNKKKSKSVKLDVETIDINRLFRKLRKYYNRERQQNIKARLKNEDDNDIANNQKKMLDSLEISNAFKNERYIQFSENEFINIEIEDLSNRIYMEIFLKFEDKTRLYIEYITKMINSFRNDSDKLYLLRILKSIIKNKYDFDEYKISETEAKNKSLIFKRMQLIYNKAGVNAICINFIRENVDYDLLLEATSLLILTLKRGNRDAQSTILELLKTGNTSQIFFNFIKSQLWKTLHAFKKQQLSSTLAKDLTGSSENKLDRENDELEKELIIAKNLIRIVQYFCENCYLEFQNFLREQTPNQTKINAISSNIVYELSIFLINLQEIDQNLLHNDMILPLAQQCLETLTDTCLGPCQENQVILARQRHLISFINTVLEEKIKFTLLENAGLVDLFATTIKFVMALIAANRNQEILISLLKQLHIERLIDQLIVIYETKIDKCNVNIFRQEIKCKHKNETCDENYCYKGYLTRKDFIITETAFNIYILLTIFLERFPNEEKVQTFRVQKIHLSLYRQYENRFGDRLRQESQNEERFNAKNGEGFVKDAILNALLQKIPLDEPKDNKKTPDLVKKNNNNNNKILPINANNEKNPELNINNGLILLNEEESVNGGDQGSEEKMSLNQEFNQKLMGMEDIKTGMNFGYKKMLTPNEAVLNSLNNESDDNTLKEYQEFIEIRRKIQINKCIGFFKGFVASVEINKDNILSKCYFQVPFECDYITENIRNDMIFKANRNSDVERLENFIARLKLYRKELIHRQSISKITILEFFVKNWRFFKDIAFVFVLANNLIMLIGYEAINDPDGQIVYKDQDSNANTIDTIQAMNLTFSIVQIFLSLIVFIFCIIERFPISIYREKDKATSSKKKNDLKKNNAVEKNTTTLVTILQDITESYLNVAAKDNGSTAGLNEDKMTFSIYLRIFSDFDNIYNLIYLIITISPFFIHPLIYSILLLDIIKRSDDLKNVIRAVTLNWKQIIKTVILGLIVLYLFSIIAFVNYRNDFEDSIDCNQLLTCWSSIIINGLRDDAGIGGSITNFKASNDQYWGLYFYILAFWILCIVLLLNFIFGIIIDTFGELRDLNKIANQEIREKCFICGKNRYEFDTKGQGWYEHVYVEHNIYNYLNYMIYIQKKNINECNGIEKYVKEQLDKTEISFFPVDKALILEENNEDEAD